MPSGCYKVKRRDAGWPSAVSFVRKLNGSSQPSIITATDGESYVMKFAEFTGERGLLNDAVGTELLAYAGLPVPNWSPIHVTDEFIDRNPGAWYRSQGGHTGNRPKAGLHFGSSLTLSKDGSEPYQIISTKWTARVSNRDHYIGALLMDLWANNCDRRQSLFLTQPRSGALRAVFIDNDHMFGGQKGDEKTCARRCMTSDKSFYSGIWTKKNFVSWRQRIDLIDDNCIASILSLIPRQWADEDARADVQSQLGRRRRTLDLLIAEANKVLVSGRFIEFERPRGALEENPFAQIRTLQ